MERKTAVLITTLNFPTEKDHSRYALVSGVFHF